MSNFPCIECGYNWGDEELLQQHLSRGDCEMNAVIRVRMRIHPSMSLERITGFEHIIDEAGLEQWCRPDDPEHAYAPKWAARVAKMTSLQGHRIWMLRLIAKSLPLQVKLCRARDVGPVIFYLLLTQKKGLPLLP